MVNVDRAMDMAFQRILRGAYVGGGSVLSGSVANEVASRTDSQAMTGVGTALIGATISVGEAAFEGPGEPLDPDGFLAEAIEFGGYGVQGAGWDEFFESMNLAGGGQSGAEVIEVNANADRRGTNRDDASGNFQEETEPLF